MKSSAFGDVVAILLLIGAVAAPVLAFVVGWVLNIVKLVEGNEAIGVLILRGVGVLLAPLGVVLGYIN